MGAWEMCFVLQSLSFWYILSVSLCVLSLLADPLCEMALPAKAWLQMMVRLSLHPRDNGEKEDATFPFQPSLGWLWCVLLPTYNQGCQQKVPALLPVPLVCNVFWNMQSPSDEPHTSRQ